MRRRRWNWLFEGIPDCVKVGLLSLSGVQWRGGEGVKMVNKPIVDSDMWTVDRMFRKAEDSNRCQKMHSKCEVQTLYSPGIAQDCVVMIDKV